MKFNFCGDIAELEKGIEILSSRLGFQIAPDGTEVTVEKADGNIEIKGNSDKISIKYSQKIHFFRALGLLCENFGGEININEEPKFKSNGIMIDASRNAVMKVEKIKEFIEIMAIMGLNLIMMYTEDTYEIPEYPHFGYMRGRYSADELRECDNYAYIFGIEMLPCIQTLAHLARALKWEHGLRMNDTSDILLVGAEDTYTFIRNAIKAATAPYRSNRVHIGMDEAWSLGLGDYVRNYGYSTAKEIIKKHFAKVMEIAEELGVSPMIWSDMYFRANSKNDDYYDTEIIFPQDVIDSVPKNCQLIYWDYYHDDVETYDKMIANHKLLCENTTFAGGIWTWGSMSVNYRLTVKNTIAALTSCIKNNISEVLATMWGDNGNQVNIYEALYGMQIYAEMGYGHEADDEHLAKRFKACTGESAKAFLSLDMFDDLGQENLEANPSEYLLWQDILMGLCDKHIEGTDVAAHYAKTAEVMIENTVNSDLCKDIFKYSAQLAMVLEIKADLGLKLKKYYDEKNINELENILYTTLPELERRFNNFKETYRELWLSVYKPFGWEVIDMRIGTVLSRIETVKFRLEQYLNNATDKIEELEEERLYFHLYNHGREHKYKDLSMRTPSYLKYVNAANSSFSFYD